MTHSLTLETPAYRAQLIPLELDVPKNLIGQLGCITATNYLGFYLETFSNEVTYDNGLMEDSVDQAAWETWDVTSKVTAHFTSLRQPDRNRETCNALVLDTTTLTFFKADEHVVRAFLYQNYVATSISPDIKAIFDLIYCP